MFFLSEINLIIPLKSELLTLAEVLHRKKCDSDCSSNVMSSQRKARQTAAAESVTDKHSLHVCIQCSAVPNHTESELRIFNTFHLCCVNWSRFDLQFSVWERLN